MHRPSATMVAAPTALLWWLPPRTTLGEPNTTWLPRARATRAVSRFLGNSEMLQDRPWYQCRMSAVVSSCEACGTPAATADAARRSMDAGTSLARDATRWANCLSASAPRPVRCSTVMASSGLSSFFTMSAVWSLKASSATRPCASQRRASASPSRLKVSWRRCRRVSQARCACADSSASISATRLSRLRKPGSHEWVTPWKAVEMPLATSCRSVSARAMRMSKCTPGRGMSWRSKASPCRSIMPGSTRRPPASSTG
ncbi:hypothetical protein D9M68_705400 [compost metagenome]